LKNASQEPMEKGS